MRVIYLDILLALNLAVNFLLLWAAAKLAGAAFYGARGLAGAALGALYSLVVLVELSAALLALSKLAVSVLMVLAAFGRKRVGEALRLTAFFYGAGFLFAGVILLAQLAAGGERMLYQNGIVYCELPAIWIVLSASAAFLAVEGFRRLVRHGESEGYFSAELVCGGHAARVPAMTDTGNSLREPFSGAPVAVCPVKLLERILPPEYIAAAKDPSRGLPGGMRIVPCRTASGAALLPAFKPDSLTIRQGGALRRAETAYVALSMDGGGLMLIGKNMGFTVEKEKSLRGERDAAWSEHNK